MIMAVLRKINDLRIRRMESKFYENYMMRTLDINSKMDEM